MNESIRIFLLALFIFLFTSVCFSQSKKDLENKKSQLQKEINLTNKLLDETKKNKKLSLNQLVTLNQKITIRQELIKTINVEILVLDRQINENFAIIESMSKDLEQLKKEYARMIYHAYKNQNEYNRLMFIFSAKDFNQAYMRLKYMQQYSEYRQKQANLIEQTQKVLNKKIADLEEKKNRQKNLLDNKEQEKEVLSQEKTEKEEVLSRLQTKEKQLKAELKKKQEDASKLQQAIQRIIQKEIEKAKEEAKKATVKQKAENKTTSQGLTLTPEAQKLSSTFELNKAKLPWPVMEGVITGVFGEQDHPVLKGIKIKNNGIDITTKQGAEVRSVFDGEVTGVIVIPGAGKAVIVRHGEYLSVYSNLSEVVVKTGEKLKTKQKIGTVITDDNSKSEVHLEIWKGSIMLNPVAWIYKNG